jgi:hypothetical protein
LLSGNRDVSQHVLPICTETRTEPQPVRLPPFSAFEKKAISAASFSGKVTKYQAPLPLYNQHFAVNDTE